MSVHLLMSAGRGPRECEWALAQLVPRVEADADAHGLTTARVENGSRSVIVRIGGAGAEAFAAGWTGTLCWHAPSPFRKHGRKNWYVTAQLCEVGAPVTSFAESDVDVVAVRTGGPGGQHRNKASTAVRATHRPTGTVIVVDTERQFSLNRALAMRQLRDRLARGDERVAALMTTERWRVHDSLVRGDPVRTERP
ncbi:peptide chain release factor-like protein [Actinoplanes sp. NBRC 103695]|uniref:peptide chain release factor-like protein n=1 Tax=Actinoplanes sp. NBRC 103695 TaxID=3032202 RepID=UPI0024A42320|nr:peptide chain release factor-like protein [Actinoplanes sp. NBRC 103695]GLY98097.1 peptide chain release factor-like protein [Actinoplanes sp. NBRC 103695]